MAWVTVDDGGHATTISPTVVTTQGQVTTVSEAPANLLSSATYTLSPGGIATTYTGLAPVASATGKSPSVAGAFPACEATANTGPVAPFCLPRPGSTLHPGTTYYITWSPSYFARPDNLSVELLVVHYSSILDPSSSANATVGFASAPVPATQGFYAWTIPADFLSSLPSSLGSNSGSSSSSSSNVANKTTKAVSSFNATLLMAYGDELAADFNGTGDAGDETSTVLGPWVVITAIDLEGVGGAHENGAGGGRNVVAIAVPVVVVVVLLMVGAVGVVLWRRRRQGLSGAGYGARQRRMEGGGYTSGGGSGAWVRGGEDGKSETDVGIQLTNRESWSPTGRSAPPGRNVFREEVERQARLG